MARKKRELPEINAGSMADIAFLLLIFFLVTTTMDVDTGIFRKLPPKMTDIVDPPPVKDRNIFVVLINQNNDLLVEDNPMDINNLTAETIRFLTSKAENMAEDPKKAVVSLRNHRFTDYQTYLAVQDKLTAAYTKVRNDAAQGKFGKNYEDLAKDQQKEIRKAYPMNISEAEPIKE
ncbi:MAG: biopolymer transporter ExbD [Flavobacteriales bacterium]|jgi:biopolymer transport protein ExbD|nr:biopolymer transporter ExbD [Flavobacteriales bacterium]